MAKRTRYTAVFADGTEKVRESERVYAAAWRARKGDWHEHGFSRTAELAEKTAHTYRNKGWTAETVTNLMIG